MWNYSSQTRTHAHPQGRRLTATQRAVLWALKLPPTLKETLLGRDTETQRRCRMELLRGGGVQRERGDEQDRSVRDSTRWGDLGKSRRKEGRHSEADGHEPGSEGQ